jgi:hypothetical protein
MRYGFNNTVAAMNEEMSDSRGTKNFVQDE